jgi:creatinine amidohydrolase
MASSRYWIELTTREIATLPKGTIAVLPTGAVEQHGPHMPVGTDALINRGIIARALELLPAELPVVILPEQTIGTSHEHLSYPGTLSHTPSEIMTIWTTALEGAVRAGVTKLLMFNSHGGQVRLLQPAALLLRQRFSIAAFYASWFDAGYPEGLFSAEEMEFGIHAGAIETSMMLHLNPALVKADYIADFPSSAAGLDKEFRLIQSDPGNGRLGGFGWLMQDLHPSGAAGDARDATAEKGQALVERAATRLVELLGEIDRFDAARQLSETTFLGAKVDKGDAR